MKVSFEGVGEQVLSFEKASGTEKNVFVKLSANNTVAACAAGDKFAGYCISTDDSFAVVKTHGYIEVGYTGTAPAVGRCRRQGQEGRHRQRIPCNQGRYQRRNRRLHHVRRI